MAKLTREMIQHTFSAASHPLDEFVRMAHEGFKEKDRGLVAKSGPEAARQLLRYLTDLPAKAKCQTAVQFLIGHGFPIDGDQAAKDLLKAWENLLSEAFKLAKVADVEEEFEGDGARQFTERILTLMRKAAEMASPALLAWGGFIGGP